MPYLQLSLYTNRDQAESVSDHLTDLGALSVTMEDAQDQPILEPVAGQTPLWQSIKLTALFAEDYPQDDLKKYLNAYPDIQSLSFNILADQNWERAWLKDFKPMSFGKRLWICPTAYDPPDPQGITIMLDPGLAFGTGTHPTTALCLEWLDTTVNHQKTIIDYGCGSGILAIAALKLGCVQAIAIDNDPQALQATLMNADQNDVSSAAITILAPDQLPPLQTDLLIANILAEPLINLAPIFKKLLNPGGRFALSGILAEQVDQIMQCYQGIGFKLDDPIMKDGWALVSGLK